MSVARLILPLAMTPALIAAATSATPAQAMLVFETPGTTHQIRFDGLTTLDGVQIAGTGALDALLTLRLTATDGLTWRFAYTIENQAGAQFDKARITGFGFDIGGNTLRSVTATGEFDRVRSGTVVDGFDTDYCFITAGNACSTNSNAGLRTGDDESGTIRLSYATRQQMVELSNLYVRWQGSQVDKALPPRTPAISVSMLPADPAPEPAAWAMMILGFGLVGAAARRRSHPNRQLA